MSLGIKMSNGGSMPGAGSIRQIPQANRYNRGDPGFFGDLWGGIKGAVGGVLTGNPLNIIGGAIGGFTGQRESVMTATPQLPPMMTMPQQIQATNGYPRPPTIKERAQMFVPGGRTGYEAMTEEDRRAGRPSSMGHHWNKSGYFLKTGEWVGKGTREVKNRRRNPLNPRALDRSISRITSAKRASKKLSRITVRKVTHSH